MLATLGVAAGCTNSVSIPCVSSGQCPTGQFCSLDGVCEEGGQGVVQTVVGGNVGDGRLASEAILRDVSGIVADDDGTIYIAELQHGRIRRIDPDGTISTIVGTGLASSGGSLPNDGRAIRAAPIGLALTAQFLYYTDDATDEVRRWDKETGTVEAIGGADEPRGIAIDPDTGLIYVGDPADNRVYRFDPMDGSRITFANGDAVSGTGGDGGQAIDADMIDPYGVALQGGFLYVSDTNRVRRIELSTGIIDRFAGGVSGSGGDGGPALSAGLSDPRHLAFDSSGNLLIADNGNNRVRVVDTAGMISTLAGGFDCCFIAEGVDPTSTFLPQPEAVAVAPDGSVLIGDNRNNLLRRVSGGTIETIAGGASPEGDVGTDARINRPFGVESDGEGGFYVVDPEASSVFHVSAGGTVTRTAGSGIRGFAGDGGPATEALLEFPEDVAVDAAGNVFIADTGNGRVRRVDVATGIISTFAGGGMGEDGSPANLAELIEPSAIEFHPDDGRLFIAERGGHRVRVVGTSGVISTIAGTGEPGTDGDLGDPLMARVNAPSGLAFDALGTLYIAEQNGQVIRRLRADGEFRVLIGQPGVGRYCGDKTFPRDACLNSPRHLAVDLTNDTLYIADIFNHRIRKYVISDGEIDSATSGGFGEGGDIESLSGAQLAAPYGLAAVPGGGLLIGNSDMGQVKLLVEPF